MEALDDRGRVMSGEVLLPVFGLYAGYDNTVSAAATTDPSPRRGGFARVFSPILGSIPTVAVLLVIGALGWWGHATGWTWKAPKFAELTGSSNVAEKEDWCAQHNVPDSRCIKCHPELVGANMKDWCPEHGVPESICTRCNDSLTPAFKAKGDWDDKHNLPKSQCFECDPSLKQTFAAAYKEKYGKEPPAGGDDHDHGKEKK